MNNERTSNRILDSLNRIYFAKQNGSLLPTELADTIVHISNVYANQVKMGIHTTEDEIDSYLASLPSQSKGYFNYEHKGLESAYKATSESINMAIFDRESRFNKVMR